MFMRGRCFYLTIYRLIFYRWREISDITNFDLLFNLSDGVIGRGSPDGSPYNIIRPFRPSVNIDGGRRRPVLIAYKINKQTPYENLDEIY